MTIVADKSGIYTGGTYGDDKIQVKKSYEWIRNTIIPEGYIIKSITINSQSSGTASIFLSTDTVGPTSNNVGDGITTGDVSAAGYKYFRLYGNSDMSGTVTITSIVIELIPNP